MNWTFGSLPRVRYDCCVSDFDCVDGRSVTKTAFSLVEVLVALAIVVLAVIPIVTMGSSSNRKASFSEYHIFFQARAVRVIEHYSLLPYKDLSMLATGPDGDIFVSLKDPPIPREFRRKLDRAVENLRFEELEPGLGRLTATMQWSFPLDAGHNGAPVHEFELSRLVSSGTQSIRARNRFEP